VWEQKDENAKKALGFSGRERSGPMAGNPEVEGIFKPFRGRGRAIGF